MGSLVPGWDSSAPGGVPKGYADFSEESEEPEGYFALYNKQKSLRRQASLGSDEAGLSQSLPTAESLHASLHRRSLPPHSELRGPFSEGPQLERLRSLPVRIGDRTESLSPTAAAAAEKGSYGTSPRLGSSPLDAYKIGGHKDPAQNYKWWRKLSSSCLNEAAEDDAMGRDTGKSYTPQYSVTGQQVNYRVEKDENPSVIPAH